MQPAHQEAVYAHDSSTGPSKGYYMPPPGAYAYYPGMPVPSAPEGSVPYYPPVMQPGDDQHQTGGALSNLPPPEIARLIPCRYYPACRYGSSCMFAHPQGPYYQNAMPPPGQYPAPYDGMGPPPYPPNFYPMQHPPFHPANGMPPHLTPVSPQAGPQSAPPQPPPPMAHTRRNSEIMPPVQAQGPYSPAGAPTPAPVPYSAMSPISPSYPNQGAAPLPLSISSLPPLNHPPPSGGPQSPQTAYPASAISAPPAIHSYDPRREPNGHYAPPAQPTQRPVQEPNGIQKPVPVHVPDGFGHRDGPNHHRRGSMRRQSFGSSRKPPCLFFPSGRCRNG
jgi:RNA-binding, Nab2-type zinc finger